MIKKSNKVEEEDWIVVPDYSAKDKLKHQDEYLLYRIKSGDSLLKLSFLTGLNKKLILEHNDLCCDQICEGMILKLPKLKIKKDLEQVKNDLGIKGNGDMLSENDCDLNKKVHHANHHMNN